MTTRSLPQDRQTSSSPLRLVRGLQGLRPQIAAWRLQGESVGLVPTMGALHAGHLALIEAARRDCDRVVVTIFVNPLQFDSPDDLASYPLREAEDRARLEAASVDLLYAPPLEDVYPAGFTTSVSVGGLTDCLCGQSRPGHMTGVATVVAKLLIRVLPDVAYFGEKDYQQFLVVRRMAQDLDMPLRVAAVPTFRDRDGLALSSRNVNLSAAARAVAPALYRVLTELADLLADGRAAEPCLQTARQELLAAGFGAIDYLELRSERDLAMLTRADRPARLFRGGLAGRCAFDRQSFRRRLGRPLRTGGALNPCGRETG